MKKSIMFSLIIIFIFTFSGAPPLFTQSDYQAELLSLDLKGMDIKDVLKILSQKSGLNIVADKDVKGTVTIYLRDVDVMDVLDIIVATQNLAYEQKGTLITVMTDTKYERLHGARFRDMTKTEIIKLGHANATEISKYIKEMKSKLGKIIPDDRSNAIVLIDNAENIKRMKDVILGMDKPLVTEVISLDYAKAEPIKEKLKEMLTKDVGTIEFDERTNRIIVKDTAKNIGEIKKVIEAFDEKTREVIIDTNIIQVTLLDKYSYGIDWADVVRLGDVELTGDTVLGTGLTSTTPSTLTIATTGRNYATVVSLLKTFGETNVLSRPRITVTDKEEARILVGAKEVYVTSEVTTTSGGTYHTTDHVQFVDVGVRLLVTPEINRDGYIKLKIKPEVSSADATKTVQLKNPDGSTRTIVPYVTTSEAETTVLVKDNTTIIIGGLMKDTIVDHKEKVPFLGDVPLLGKLFSTTGKSKEKTELVIFLTPHIIEGDRTLKEAEHYIDEWREKEAQGKIQRPEDLKFDASNMAADKKKQKVMGREGAGLPKKKWTPISMVSTKKSSVDEPIYESKVSEIKPPGSIAIGAQQKSYEEYYMLVRSQINEIAVRQDVSGIKGEVELKFTLDKKGFVISGPVVLNKPDLKLVRAAVGCVKQASPFPEFPRDIKKDEQEFYVIIRYE